MRIPEPFAAGLIEREDAAGAAWLAELPSLIDDLCATWTLRIDGPPRHGHLALVVPVRRGEEPCALKISWRDASTAHEVQALRAWDGRGTVRLLEAEPTRGALLLERLDATRCLHGLPVAQAVRIAGELIGLLAIPGDPSLPPLTELAASIAGSLRGRWQRFGRSVPRRLVEQAVDHALNLPMSSDRRLVNWDLHDGNVLAGTRLPWLAIDPKVVVGSPEFGVAQLLWTRIDEMERASELERYLRVLIETAHLDAPLTRAWTLVRVVDYWLWALSIGLTEDPARCATIVEWLGFSRTP